MLQAASAVLIVLAALQPGRVMVTLTSDGALSAAEQASLRDVIASSVRRDPAFQTVADPQVAVPPSPDCASSANLFQPTCGLERARGLGAAVWLVAKVSRFSSGYSFTLESYDVATSQRVGSTSQIAKDPVSLGGEVDRLVAEALRFAPRPSAPYEAPVALRAPLELIAAAGLSAAGAYGSYQLAHAVFDSRDCPDYVSGCEGSFGVGVAGAAAGAAFGTIGVATLLHGRGSWLWAAVGALGGTVPALIAWQTAKRDYGGRIDESYADAAIIGASPAVGAVLGYELSAALRPQLPRTPAAGPTIALAPSASGVLLVGSF